ncbi:MAG: hypothetical protein WBA61_13175 [Aequorivita sp.]
MKVFTFYTTLVLWAMVAISAQSQNEDSSNSVEELTELKEKVIQQEKDMLKLEIELIHKKMDNNSITKEEAETLKVEAAEKRALNIENRVAIIDNKIALIERNGEEGEKGDSTHLIINIGQANSENERNFGVSVKTPKRKVVYDKRTTSGPVIGFGLNNVITEDESLEDSDFKVAGSRFFEIGWTWNTRVFENSNWLRVKYGFSFQFNGLKPTDNRYLVDTGDETELQTYPLDLKKSKFRMDNLVLPVYFEFGPSKKVEHKDYFRYTTHNQFKVGFGGYGGINLSTRQKLEFKEDGETKKEKLKANFNTNNFVYGIGGYIGWGSTSLYLKYDLNTIFKNNAVDQRNISLGLRFDLD